MYAASPFSYNNNLNLWLWSLYTFFFADNFLELWGAQVLPLNHHEGRLKNCCKFYCKPQKVKNTHTHIFQTRKKEGWYLVHKQFIYKKHTSFWWKSFSDYQLAKQKFCPSTVWFVLLSIYPPPRFYMSYTASKTKKQKTKTTSSTAPPDVLDASVSLHQSECPWHLNKKTHLSKFETTPSSQKMMISTPRPKD